MLKTLLQSREEKLRLKIEKHINEGLNHLSNKLFNGAMIEFDKAMSCDGEAVYVRLVDELSKTAGSGQLESALAIGLNLINKNPEDFELVNKLGNYAREIKDYRQANNLYKTALKINPNCKIAFYNLAASSAKADIYDEAIISALSQFDNVSGHILPEYLENQNIIEELTEKAAKAKEERYRKKMKRLMNLKNEKTDAGDLIEARKLEIHIEKLKKGVKKVTNEDIISEFIRLIKEDSKHQSVHKYNLSLYAIHEKKPDLVIEMLEQLSIKDFEHLDLLKVIAIGQKGHLKRAIDTFHHLLGKNEYNRYYNVNLGLMYRKAGKRFLAVKYLIKTAALLEKSNGVYSMKELLQEADEAYDQARYKKALNYYSVIVNELNDAEIWGKIGSIFTVRKKYDKAVDAFRRMQQLDPNSNTGEAKLREIHDYYVEKAESLFTERKFKASVEYFEKALKILRLHDIIKRTAETYKQHNNTDREQELLTELHELIEKEKAEEQEEFRQQMILKGKQLLKDKIYAKAIETFEAVFRMKVDRDIFIQLAMLYKGLKYGDGLASLENRWEKMLEHEEKLRKYEKKQTDLQPATADC